MITIALQNLVIKNCKNLESLPKELHTLTSLQNFVIESYPALVSFQITGSPIVLQKLEIRNCKNLEFQAKGLQKLTNMKIEECSSLINCKNQEPVFCGLRNLTTSNSHHSWIS
ncbi:hypothetical protein NE237_004610 [Protea cynaroides]|uniref:Uncharacterized protein n=1 Tax=Protea cynaroides TaxID=273540 RepID=A0A9Q0KJS8_9MAGN|nr:hypothetical protein NE237_004610 [Protea cynaroides]